MFVIMKSIEHSFPKRTSYYFLTKESEWDSDENKAKEFPTQNSAKVLMNKIGLNNNNDIIVIER